MDKQDALLDFEWQVASTYRWVKFEMPAPGPGDGFRFSGPHTVLVAGGPARRYRPFREYPTLFRDLSSTPATPDRVLAFAQRFGGLGEPVACKIARPGNAPPLYGEELYGPFSWHDTIDDLAWAIAMWEGILRGTTPHQDQRAWAKALAYWNPIGQSPFEGPKTHDSRAWASTVLAACITANLKSALVAPRVVFDGRRFRETRAPLSLLGVVWTQLAMAITEQKCYPPCRFCQRPFEVSKAPTGKRVNREFCSDKCKSAEYRQRKTLARQLAARNKPLDQIVKRTRTKRATVKTWLKGDQ